MRAEGASLPLAEERHEKLRKDFLLTLLLCLVASLLVASVGYVAPTPVRYRSRTLTKRRIEAYSDDTYTDPRTKILVESTRTPLPLWRCLRPPPEVAQSCSEELAVKETK
jgi:hypothetical protein